MNPMAGRHADRNNPDATRRNVDLDRVWPGVAAEVWRRRPRAPRTPGRAAAALTGAGQGAADHSVAADALADRHASSCSRGAPRRRPASR